MTVKPWKEKGVLGTSSPFDRLTYFLSNLSFSFVVQTIELKNLSSLFSFYVPYINKFQFFNQSNKILSSTSLAWSIYIITNKYPKVWPVMPKIYMCILIFHHFSFCFFFFNLYKGYIVLRFLISINVYVWVCLVLFQFIGGWY